MPKTFTLSKSSALKNCSLCGSPVRVSQIDLKQEKGGQVFILKKVPAYVCENCQEIWLADVILDEFRSYVKLRSVKHNGKRQG